MAQSVTACRDVRPFHMEGGRYEQYVYSYPHKLAYGPIEPARSLAEVWAREPKDSLFLYVHVPFCEQRCGFCNLFTFANPNEELPDRYMAALERQMLRTRAALGAGATFSQYAVGGGTPTYLSAASLARLLDRLSEVMGLDTRAPGSVETSPVTATEARLRVLRERGVTRVSMGVQSFDDEESASVGRRQSARDVHEAVRRIRGLGFPTLNLDLMYGLPEQSEARFLASLRAALEHRPEELYLYPLYVRRLTVLGRATTTGADDRRWDDVRVALYRAGRALLLSEGYAQVSMRMFRRGDAPATTAEASYQCQRDGMVGLGPGARSYTDRVHYSTAYAVGPQRVRSILESYADATQEDFDCIIWGYELSDEEKRRRFVLLSLLHESGLDCSAYANRFGADPREHVPELAELLLANASEPLLVRRGDRLVLTSAGLERSDQIGPYLMSAAVRERVARGPSA